MAQFRKKPVTVEAMQYTRETRAAVRALAQKGYARTERLFDDEGHTAGSGYRVTKEGIAAHNNGEPVADREGSEVSDEPTGEMLVARWPDKGHQRLAECPKCGGGCLRVGITNLAHIHAACGCDYAAYPHLIEQLWHVACLIEDAPKVVERNLLEDALYAVRNYKRGQSTAARIRAYLARPAIGPTEIGGDASTDGPTPSGDA